MMYVPSSAAKNISDAVHCYCSVDGLVADAVGLRLGQSSDTASHLAH